MSQSHYVTADEISAEMRAKIAELRERCAPELARYPEYNNDFSLLRWLMGWDYDVEAVVPKLKFCLSTLRALNLHAVEYESIEEINEFIRAQTPAADYFPGGLVGHDSAGNAILVHAITKTHPKSLSQAGRVSEFFRLCTVEGELAFKVVRRKEAEVGKKLGINIIVDLDGFSMDLLYAPALKGYLNLLVLTQALFPDFARNIYVINCPAMLSVPFAIVQPVLSKQTREKLHFLGADWKEKLAAELGSENIYPHWGGTKPIPASANGKPTGTIRMGGKVPEEIWYKNDKKKIELSDKELRKLNVGARSSKKIEVAVEKPGMKLKWYFKCSGGDIDFSISKDGVFVWPRFRISTDFVPEFGEIDCEVGKYEVEFDNGHGKVWSKDIRYSVRAE